MLPKIYSVDLVVAEAPYTFGLNSTDDGASWGDLMNASRVYTRWLREFRRLTSASNGAAWVFNSWRSFPTLARGANEAGWPINSLLVWDKVRMGAGTLRGLRWWMCRKKPTDLSGRVRRPLSDQALFGSRIS
jgi:hypothetical protein